MASNTSAHYTLEDDEGLRYLLALYDFLGKIVVHVYHILVQKFRDAEYIKINLNKKVKLDMKLLHVLNQINSIERVKCKSSKSKRAGQGQSAPPCDNRSQSKIANVDKNEKLLQEVTVQDLLEWKDNCRKLLELDLIFMLSIITNSQLNYCLPTRVKEALYQLKDIRTNISHFWQTLTFVRFEEYLNSLVKAVLALGEVVSISREKVEQLKTKCSNQASSPQPIYDHIFSELQNEARPSYKKPKYVIPSVTKKQMQSDEVIEDLVKYVGVQQSCGQQMPPLLLCGEQGTGKLHILRSLAHALCDTFPLVLLLDQDRLGGHRLREELWDFVHCSLAQLFPKTCNAFGEKQVQAVVQHMAHHILFLVHWDVVKLGPVREQMEHGTWLLTHHTVHPFSPDWQVMMVQRYSEAQAQDMLGQLVAETDRVHVQQLFQQCSYKSLLINYEMIKVFSQLQSQHSCGTDFELAEEYVSHQLKCIDEETVINLGQLAFKGIRKNWKQYQAKDICKLKLEIQEKFFRSEDGKLTFRFVNLLSQDYFAARFVEAKPLKACKDWLDNANKFQRVFKFACSLWFRKVVDWKQPKNEEIKFFIEQYLAKLFCVESLLSNAHKEESITKRNQEAEKMETECKVETEEDMKIDVDSQTNTKTNVTQEHKIKGNQVLEKKEVVHFKKKKTPKIPIFINPEKNPFSKWEFLFQLDNACQGHRVMLMILARLLSHIPCWLFKRSVHLDDGKLKRLKYILKKVELKRRAPVSIRLESNSDITTLLSIWNTIKNIESLHKCANVKITVLHEKNASFSDRDSLALLPKCIAYTHQGDPIVYITEYICPYLTPSVDHFSFLKCTRLSRLERVEVSVYDLASLRDILDCRDVSSLTDVSVRVNLKISEQNLDSIEPIALPSQKNLSLIITYFDKIQTLLDKFSCRDNLTTLTIHELHVNRNFELDLTKFEKLQSCNIRCEEASSRNTALEKMEVEKCSGSWGHRQPQQCYDRSMWIYVMTNKMKLPKQLQRLLLRNVEFYNNRNNDEVRPFLQKYNLSRLLVLDCMLTLRGVRDIVCNLSETSDEAIAGISKKLRVNSTDTAGELPESVVKRERISKMQRDERRLHKPEGREIIITSNVTLCSDCKTFPCECTEKKNDTWEDLTGIIEDIYFYNIISFSYSSDVCSIQKDVCEDLRFRCMVTALDDRVASDLSSAVQGLNQLLKQLILAQMIHLEGTSLSCEGVKKVIRHIIELKKNCDGCVSSSGQLEKFDVTIASTFHPLPTQQHQLRDLLSFVSGQPCISVFNFWCVCNNKCYTAAKKYHGNLLLNRKEIKIVEEKV